VVFEAEIFSSIFVTLARETASQPQGRVPQACAVPHCAPIRWLWFTETSAVLPCPARVTCVSMCARPKEVIALYSDTRVKYSGTSVVERLSSRTNQFPNIKPKQKTHRFPNRISVPEQVN
jgi:hypothetical protein